MVAFVFKTKVSFEHGRICPGVTCHVNSVTTCAPKKRDVMAQIRQWLVWNEMLKSTSVICKWNEEPSLVLAQHRQFHTCSTEKNMKTRRIQSFIDRSSYFKLQVIFSLPKDFSSVIIIKKKQPILSCWKKEQKDQSMFYPKFNKK